MNETYELMVLGFGIILGTALGVVLSTFIYASRLHTEETLSEKIHGLTKKKRDVEIKAQELEDRLKEERQEKEQEKREVEKRKNKKIEEIKNTKEAEKQDAIENLQQKLRVEQKNKVKMEQEFQASQKALNSMKEEYNHKHKQLKEREIREFGEFIRLSQLVFYLPANKERVELPERFFKRINHPIRIEEGYEVYLVDKKEHRIPVIVCNFLRKNYPKLFGLDEGQGKEQEEFKEVKW